MLEQLNLPKGIYDPAKYPNPSLQWHYRILQALALDDELPEKPEDKTLPKYRQIDKRVGSATIEWGSVLERVFKEYQADYPDAVAPGSKRPTSTNGHTVAASGAHKKVRTEGAGTSGEEDIRKLWQKGQLSHLTVAQLKEFAATKKIVATGKKADIVEKIEAWLETK
jgi:ATP-dependent DNA helicase 2 subunit 1